ncbi:MAG: biotin carboxylase N-terminal domain-containing protein [Myxococcota bacterium]
MQKRTIQRVLVGCPGEVGASIVRSVESAGMEAVAAFDDRGADAAFLDEAAYAVHVTGDAPWRDGMRIVSAALDSGADAVHPGVAGLARDPTFARMVANVGLAWIGPLAQQMEDAGDLDALRRRGRDLGIEPVPHSPALTDVADIERWTSHFGSPIWVRCATRGGPRGGLARSVDEARRLAARLAPHPVMVERAILPARHVVAIVLGDGQGNALYVGDHDRSLVDARGIVRMRECPSPGFEPEARARLGDAAARLAEELKYVGVGGVEFLVGADGHAWLHDLDPGLPPGYRVHDAAYGIDLVTAQIELAGGQTLGWSQEELRPERHAIEVVIVGEAPGEIGDLVLPDGIDVTTALVPGAAFDPARDPVLARLRADGPTRHAAIVRLQAALREVRIEGVPHDTDRLLALLGDPDTWEGRVHTGSWLRGL